MSNRISKQLAIFAPLCLSAGLVACKTLPEVNEGQPLIQEGVSLTVLSTEVKYVELETPTGAAFTSEPVLVATFEIANRSQLPVTYTLGRRREAATQAQEILLFSAPPAETPLNELTLSAANIPFLNLGDATYLADPVRSEVTIPVGETITDVILFETPPATANGLVLSVPPRFFGAQVELPGFVRIPYTAAADGSITPPSPISESTWRNDDLEFEIIGTEALYVPMTNQESAAGYSEEPLLKLNFRVRNTGEEALTYTPPEVSTTIDSPTLLDQEGNVITLSTVANAYTLTDAVYHRSAHTIAAGDTLETFLLFEQPSASVNSLTLVSPAKRFGSTGSIRMQMDYSFTEVEMPANHPNATPPEAATATTS